MEKYNGILLINKEKNMTSRDVVNIVSKKFDTKKVGHTGTLDPLAEGVLVLTIGRATKLGNLLTSSEKEYIATVKRGILTDTLDIDGKNIKEKNINESINLEKLLKSFEKTYMQEVPIYSAVKVNGKKLYEYARNNIDVKLPEKKVTIKEIELLEQDKDTFKFRCIVSKGTYIRSLIRDMGNEINEYFTMTNLIRTKQGDFDIKNCYSIDDIKNNNFKIVSIDKVLESLPTIKVNDILAKKIENGVQLDNIYNIKDKVVFKDKRDNVIAIYKCENNILKNYVMIKI